jgi:hypothetical protein
MIKRLSWLAFAAIGSLPALSRADPLLSFGPDVPLFITAAASIRRDDNVDLVPQNKTADTIYIFAPGTDLHYSGGKSSAGLTLGEQFIRYASDSHLNDNLADAVGNFSYKGSESSMSLAASYAQTDQSTLSSTNTNQTLKQSLSNASFNGELGIAPKTSLGVGATFSRTAYPEASFSDSDGWSFPVDLYYAVTPKVDLSMGYNHGQTTIANNPDDDSKTNFFNIGARGDFTPKLSGQIRVGETELKPEKGPTSSQLGLGASLDYLFSPKTSFDLSANNGFSNSAVGTNQELLTLSSSGHFELSQAWALTTGLSYSSTKYLTVPERIDRFWVGNVGINYTLTTVTAFQLEYLYRKNDSTLAAADFNDNILTFSASSRF